MNQLQKNYIFQSSHGLYKLKKKYTICYIGEENVLVETDSLLEHLDNAKKIDKLIKNG